MWYQFNEDNSRVVIKYPRQKHSSWIGEEEIPHFLVHPEESDTLQLTKIDENGTKYYKTNMCPECDGIGGVFLGSHNDYYKCHVCNGEGKLKRSKTYAVHTYEYGLVLEKEHLQKRNMKFFEDNGINPEDHSTYVYIGNTYHIKDILKLKGAKYDSVLGKWHSKDLIEGYPYIKVTVPLKIFSDGRISYDPGYNEDDFHGRNSENRTNYFLDELLELIKKEDQAMKAKQKLKNTSSK